MIPYCILVIEDESDRAFMESLYHNYRRLMYKTIKRIIDDPWSAEDLMQSVLVKLIDKLALLRSKEEQQVVSYIVSACRNTAYNYVRDHKKERETPYEEYLVDANSEQNGHRMEFALIREEEMDCLARVWPKLDEKSRHILEGYYILEKPMSELGKELGIKTDSVRMTLARARRKAYELLEKELEESR